jgi:hypothetical protein
MTKNVFRTTALCTAITLCCASGVAQEAQAQPPGSRTTRIIDAEKAKAKSLSPVEPSHGEHEFDRFEEKIVDPIINPNGLTYQLEDCLREAGFPLVLGTSGVTGCASI